MVSLPVTPGGLRIRFVGTFNNTKWVNVLHAAYSGGTPSTADLNQFASDLATLWNTDWAPLMHISCGLTLTDVQDLASNVGNYGSSNTSHAGTIAPGVALPASIACAVSWTIARHYRGGHPRTYLPGMASGSTNSGNSGQWLSTFTSSVQTNMTAFLTAVNAKTYTTMTLINLAAVSYYSGKVLRPTGITENITGAKVHPRIDSQRRRLGKETP